MIESIKTWFNNNIIPEWTKLWKAWSMWFAGLGLALPSLLQLMADNLSGMDWFSDSTKTMIRIACLVGVVLSRPIKQPSVSE